MEDLYHRVIRPFVGRGGVRDIEKVEVRARDADCWLVFLRTRQGSETRIAAESEADARVMAAQIESWRRQPASVPPPRAVLSRRGGAALAWLVFLIVAVGLAIDGALSWSLVSGWVVTRHFLPALAASAIVVTALVASVGAPGSRHPFQWGVLPLCLFLAVLFASAGKSVNARVGVPQPIEVEGPIVAFDGEAWDIRATQRTRIQADLVVMQVEDTRTRKRYEIEVPAWVAEREGIRLGAVWRDRFHRGAFGWLYREGTVWDERAFRPGIAGAS